MTVLRSYVRQFFHSMNIVAVTIVLLGGCATSEETKQRSRGYYQEGMASLETDRQKAFVSFQKAVQLNPDNKEARYGLGHILVSQGKLAQGEVEFREAIKIDENYSEAHTYLGQVLINQDRWPEAIVEFRRALSNPLYTTPDLARFHLGRALAHEKDYQGAMLQLELGRVYYKLGFERRAKEALTKVTALDKNGDYAVAAKEILARLKP